MLIIRFQGGLGNQMFQYALYREIKTRRQDVKADLHRYDWKIDKRKYQLGEVFGIEMEAASQKEVRRLSGGEQNKLDLFIGKYFKRKTIVKEEAKLTIDKIVDLKDGYLDGYWQGEYWFPSVQAELKDDFSFIEQEKSGDSVYKDIVKCNSVSIHIRMGDYLENSTLYGNICTREYYKRGINKIQEYVSDPVYFIFSDEINKAAELLDGLDIDARYVDRKDTDSGDMRLMSCCKHNIIANSSFSWWGTWLNRHEDKIVISPSKWNGADYDTRIFCKDWILI